MNRLLAIALLAIALEARPPAQIMNVAAEDLIAFHKHYDPMFRAFFGCSREATKPEQCVAMAGFQDGREWKKARPIAAKLFQLHE